MMSVSEIFAALGGNSRVARLLGVGSSTTSEMKRRGRIPVDYWSDIVDAAQRLGRSDITLEALAKLHARKPETSQVAGFSEEAKGKNLRPPDGADSVVAATGHFSRWRHLRRPHFASMEEINAHVSALRGEWDRR